MTRLLIASMLAAASLALAGCPQLLATPTPRRTSVPYTGPVVTALDASPLRLATRNDVLTLSAVATDPTGAPLTYTWVATKGTLGATDGSRVTWKSARPDGTLEPGRAMVTVRVSNGRESISSNIHLLIAEDGSTTVQLPGSLPITVPTPTTAPPGGAPSDPTSPTPEASGPVGVELKGPTPTVAAPGTVFNVSGKGFSGAVSVTVGGRPASVLDVAPERVAVLLPPSFPASFQPQPIRVTVGGQARSAAGTLTVADMSDFNATVRTAGAGLLVAAHRLSPGATEVPEDLAARQPFATFLSALVDMAPRAFGAGLPSSDGEVYGDFALQYTGKLKVPSAGTTRFSLLSADGAKLFIDGRLVIDNDGVHAPASVDGLVELTAGSHDLRLDYFKRGTGTVALQLYWQPPGQAFEAIVPASALSQP